MSVVRVMGRMQVLRENNWEPGCCGVSSPKTRTARTILGTTIPYLRTYITRVRNGRAYVKCKHKNENKRKTYQKNVCRFPMASSYAVGEQRDFHVSIVLGPNDRSTDTSITTRRYYMCLTAAKKTARSPLFDSQRHTTYGISQ